MGNIYPTLSSPSNYDLNQNATWENSFLALEGFHLSALNRENKSFALNYFTLGQFGKCETFEKKVKINVQLETTRLPEVVNKRKLPEVCPLKVLHFDN